MFDLRNYPYYGRGNGNLFQKDLCWHAMPPRTASVSVPDPVIGHCQPTPPPETLEHSQVSLLRGHCSFLLSPVYTRFCFCPSRVSVSPVMWKFCNQISLVIKVNLPGGSQSFCSISRLGNLLWAPELLQQCKNFFGIIVLQFVSRLLGGSKVGLNGYLLQEDLCHTPRLPGLLLLESLSLQQATLTHASSGDTKTLKGRSGSVSLRSWCAQGFVCAL